MSFDADFFIYENDVEIITSIELYKVSAPSSIIGTYIAIACANSIPIWKHKFNFRSFNELMTWAFQFPNIKTIYFEHVRLKEGQEEDIYHFYQDYCSNEEFNMLGKFWCNGKLCNENIKIEITDYAAQKIKSIVFYKHTNFDIVLVAYDFTGKPKYRHTLKGGYFKEFVEWVSKFPNIITFDIADTNQSIPELPDYQGRNGEHDKIKAA